MEIITIIIIIAIAVGLFFLCRQLNCWYLKINERIDLMNQMLDNQEEIIRLLGGKVTEDNTYSNADGVLENNEENSEDAVYFEVGQKVFTNVEKYNVPANTCVRVEKSIPEEGILCSLDMKVIGVYSYEEVHK